MAIMSQQRLTPSALLSLVKLGSVVVMAAETAFISAWCSFRAVSSNLVAKTSVLAVTNFFVFFFLSFLAKKLSRSAILVVR